ncbi:MAG: hypothetical protein NZ777_14270, partial [Pseudomonadales bacterium]|nr:hypothetical protein [Pseudomonadales bacterium]
MKYAAEIQAQSRRQFFTSAASGLGGLALTQMLSQDHVLQGREKSPLALTPSHYAPKAKRCIFIFL